MSGGQGLAGSLQKARTPGGKCYMDAQRIFKARRNMLRESRAKRSARKRSGGGCGAAGEGWQQRCSMRNNVTWSEGARLALPCSSGVCVCSRAHGSHFASVPTSPSAALQLAQARHWRAGGACSCAFNRGAPADRATTPDYPPIHQAPAGGPCAKQSVPSGTLAALPRRRSKMESPVSYFCP